MPDDRPPLNSVTQNMRCVLATCILVSRFFFLFSPNLSRMPTFSKSKPLVVCSSCCYLRLRQPVWRYFKHHLIGLEVFSRWFCQLQCSYSVPRWLLDVRRPCGKLCKLKSNVLLTPIGLKEVTQAYVSLYGSCPRFQSCIWLSLFCRTSNASLSRTCPRRLPSVRCLGPSRCTSPATWSTLARPVRFTSGPLPVDRSWLSLGVVSRRTNQVTDFCTWLPIREDTKSVRSLVDDLVHAT